MFTKVAAVELGPYGIRVNCVAPGAVEVERTKLEDPDYAGTWGRITPLGRVGQPSDIGRAVAYMVSPEAEFVTGQTIGSMAGCTRARRGPTSPPDDFRILLEQQLPT